MIHSQPIHEEFEEVINKMRDKYNGKYISAIITNNPITEYVISDKKYQDFILSELNYPALAAKL